MRKVVFPKWWEVRRAIAKARLRFVCAIVEALCGATMLWDDENLEEPIYSIEEWASNYGMRNGEKCTVTFQRALSLKSRTVEITAIDADDGRYLVRAVPVPKKKAA